jgi:hypothetical protein
MVMMMMTIMDDDTTGGRGGLVRAEILGHGMHGMMMTAAVRITLHDVQWYMYSSHPVRPPAFFCSRKSVIIIIGPYCADCCLEGYIHTCKVGGGIGTKKTCDT